MTENKHLSEPAVLWSLLLPLLAGLYLLLTSTMIVIPGIWPYDAKRILQFALLLIFFLLPLLNSRIRSEFSAQLYSVPAWLNYSLLAVILMGVVSAAIHARSAMHAVNSLSEVALMSLLVLAALLVAACRRIGGRTFDRIIIGSFVITGMAVGVQELTGVLAAHAGGTEFSFRVSLLYFSWPRFFNQVQGWMLLPLVSLVVLFPGNRLVQVITLMTLGLQWYVIFMTGARGVFLSIMTGILLAALLLPAIRKRLVLWQAAGLLAGFLIYLLVMLSFDSTLPQDTAVNAQDPGQHGNSGSSDSRFYQQSLGRPMTDSSGRIWMWKTAFGMGLENPWLGIGPLNLVCVPGPELHHPHNFPLQLMAEWGIPVALAVCLIVMIMLKSAIIAGRNPGNKENQLFGFLLTGAFTASVYALLSGVFVMPASQVSGLLILGGMLGLLPVSANRMQSGLPFPVFLIPVLLAIGLLLHGIFELSTMETRASLLGPEESMFPRTWQDAMVCRHYSR